MRTCNYLYGAALTYVYVGNLLLYRLLLSKAELYDPMLQMKRLSRVTCKDAQRISRCKRFVYCRVDDPCRLCTLVFICNLPRVASGQVIFNVIFRQLTLFRIRKFIEVEGKMHCVEYRVQAFTWTTLPLSLKAPQCGPYGNFCCVGFDSEVYYSETGRVN